MDITKLQFKPNLQRMALNTSAVAFWERTDTKLKVKKFFYTKAGRNTNIKWKNLVKEVIKEAKPVFLGLPSILYCELLYVIKDVGNRIYGWFRYIKKSRLFGYTHRKHVYDVYTETIVWTHYGTIDEVKTLKSWMNKQNVDYSKVYNMASRCCLQEDLNSIWDRVSERQRSCRYDDIWYRYGTHIVAYWQSYQNGFDDDFIEKLKSHSGDFINLYDEEISVEENMLRLSARKVYQLGVKYFWEKLSNEDKERSFIDCLRYALYPSIQTLTVSDYKYRNEQCIEVFIFFLSQMSKANKEQLMEKKYPKIGHYYFKNIIDSTSELIEEILRSLLLVWPWQEFLIPTMELFKEYMTVENYTNLFHSLCWKMSKTCEYDVPIEDSIYQRKIYELWRRTPSNFKAQISKSIVGSLFDVWDLKNIKMIINDKAVVDERQSLLIKGYDKFLSLIAENKKDMIDQFIRDVLIRTEWDKNIQKNLNTLYNFNMEGEICLADDFLNDCCCSEEEKNNYKNKLNADVLCFYFIKKNRLDQADKFLMWKYNSDEKIGNFKKRLKYRYFGYFKHKFSCEHVYKLWTVSKENASKAAMESSNFLRWFLENEDEVVAFKKEKFLKPFMKQKWSHGLEWNYFNFEIVDDFFYWCGGTKSELQQFKQKIRKYTVLSRCLDLIQKRELNLAEKFLEWAIESEEERRKFVGSFFAKLKEKKYALKCFIGVWSEIENKPLPSEKEMIEKYKKFIEVWIKPLEEKNMLKKELLKWRGDTVKREDDDFSYSGLTESSTDMLDSNHEDAEISDGYEIFCKKKYLDIFISLFSSMCDV